MKFNDIVTEAVDYQVKFHYFHNHKGVVDSYLLERKDGVKGFMNHLEGKVWRGTYGAAHFEGSLSHTADWVLGMVANEDPS